MPLNMSTEAIDQRLREAARLSILRLPYPPRVDMGPAAVEQRLREVAQLHALERRLRELRPAP